MVYPTFVIDWDRIGELRAEIGDDDFAEVLDLFFEDVDDAVAKLRSATGQGPLADALHFLKGSAQNLGLSEVSALCAQAETRPGDVGKSGPDIETIIAALATAREELRQHGS